MTAKRIENAAYVAAHRILETNTDSLEFVCPGARRSHTVDTIARIIREVFEPQLAKSGELASEQGCDGPTGLLVVNGRRAIGVQRLTRVPVTVK